MRPASSQTRSVLFPPRNSALKTLRSAFRLASLLLLLLAAASPSAPARAADEIQLLGEDFQDKDTKGWTLNDWSIGLERSGNYFLEAKGHTFAELPPEIQVGETPFRLRFQVKDLLGVLHANFMTRDVRGGWDRYALDLSRFDTSILNFDLWKQYTSPPGETLARAQTTDFYTGWYQIEIIFDKGSIQVNAYPAGKEPPFGSPGLGIIDIVDLKPLAAGGISFEVEGEYAAIDNVEVFAQTQPVLYLVSGQVFSGEIGDRSHPLPGVTVSAYGSNDPYPAEGEFLGSAITDPEGWFYLDIPDGYEFYAVRETNLAGYISTDADSSAGKAPSLDWIEIIAPLEGKDLSRNDFWDRMPVDEFPRQVTIPPPLGPAYPECPPGEELLFADDLNDPDRSANWATGPGWQLVNGQLQGDGPASAMFGWWQDVRLRAVIGLRDGRPGVLLNTRVDSNRRYALFFETHGLTLGKQTSPGEFIEFANRAIEIDTGIWHTLEIASMGDLVTASLDGELLMEYRDPEPLSAGAAGVELPGKSFAIIDAIWACGLVDTTPTPTHPAVLPRLTRTPAPTRTPQRGIGIITPGGGGSRSRTGLPPWAIPAGVVLVVLAGGLLLFGRSRPPRQPGEPDKGRKPPPLPGLPPVRLINLWLTEGSSGTGKRLDPKRSLVTGETYSLNLQIQSREGEPRRSAPPAEQAALQVVFFTPEDDFSLEGRRAGLSLPDSGSSEVLARPISPRRSGRLQVRACVYYNNTLVQSALLEVSAGAAGERVPAGGIVRSIDYVASSRWNTLAQLPRPRLNIFANQAANGSHWLGLFSSDETAPENLRQGDLHTFATGQLTSLAEQTRQALVKIEGERLYRLSEPVAQDEAAVQRRAKDLAELARNGYILYDTLFLSQEGGLEMDRLDDLHAFLQEAGMISIARCRDEAESLPWAALYSLPLDTNRVEDLSLCEVYAASLLTGDGGALLSQPEACLKNPDCPLRGEQARYRVCPFGFWGVLHQIEQPVQKVTPTHPDQVPEELRSPHFEQSTRLERKPGAGVRLAIGAYPGMPQVEPHRQEIAALGTAGALEVAFETDRGMVMQLIGEGGRQLYYFYCHGDVEANQFRLRLGPAGAPGFISAADLDPFSMRWKESPYPLVFLNGCETMASRPELIHGFLGKLLRLGALGAAGSEIKVWTDFARPFGYNVIRDLLSGCSVGEAFLNARRLFMRDGNPLGLVYSLHAPAALHVHDANSCEWCIRQGIKEKG